MTKFNKARWIEQELAKFTADNFDSLRAAHQKTIDLADQFGLDASESGVRELLAAADAKFRRQPSGIQTLGDLFAEDEERRLAEANTPERIAEDEALWQRNRERMAAELERLEAQGMIDHGSDDDSEEEDEDEA